MSDKKMYGQFFTIVNPFDIDVFKQWFQLIPEGKREKLLEPFAGSNNIVKMIKDLGYNYNWGCYDIAPNDYNAAPEFPIIQQDTISCFPTGYSIAITNPPYLAKNSATRSGISFPYSNYDDLYKVCLDVMLSNLDYVAAIIPESFINANEFYDRLYAFVSLTCKMFEDTDCPVCLVLFMPKEQKIKVKLPIDDFYIYRQNKKIGTYLQLKDKKPVSKIAIEWKFNDPDGTIGIKCIDNTKNPSICFVPGNQIDKSKVKVSSRSITRVSGLPNDISINDFIKECNIKLNTYREETNDIFLTSFKGLREDNMYRRRLDFANAKVIMNSVVENIRK